MGVYIKGMEMPTSCWDCYFQDCGNCRLNAHKVVDRCIIEDRRDEDCPLVPVPPHGDLIDRDALILRVDMHGTNKFGMLDEDIRQFINSAPTIIPADPAEEGE